MDLSSLPEVSALLENLRPYQESSRLVQQDMRSLLAGLTRHAELGDDGPLMVLMFGGANTGKSTLFNAITAKDLSPAQAVAGATRHVLVYVPEAAMPVMSTDAVWPAPYRPELLPDRASLTAEITPRRFYLARHEDPALAHVILADSPDMTTAHANNARVTGQALLLTDVVVLVLTDEQHADKILVDHFPTMRDLGKKVIAVFNRVKAEKAEQLAAFQKFRLTWLENRMGAMPDRHFVPKMTPGGVPDKLRADASFQALYAQLTSLDRRDLREQTKAGMMMALRQKGGTLVSEMEVERDRIRRAIHEIQARYRTVIAEYNSRRRWASRMLTVRSWLQSTFGGKESLTDAPKRSAEQEAEQWQVLLTPLMGHADRPSALEGLELMGEALETDPNPAPLYRPFSRMYRGMSDLLFGPPTHGKADDSSSLLDALDLLEKTRCSFVSQEVLSRSLGPEWANALGISAGSTSVALPAVQPANDLERIAAEYRDLAGNLKRSVIGLLESDPGVRARLAQRHARLALAAGITMALALIDMGQSALALGVGLSAPMLWELMDWAASRPELNEELRRFGREKATWFERAFYRHVTGTVYDTLIKLEAHHDPSALKIALRR